MQNQPSKTPSASGNENRWIDLNCDVGESTGDHIVGNDHALIPIVTSANIACGAHAGDREHITSAVRLAVQHDVAIGAHPGYPDRENFGRHMLELSEQQLSDTLRQQFTFLSKITSENEATIKYIKPHGALYHRCNFDASVARLLVEVALEFDSSLSMMGQTNTKFEEICQTLSVPFIREAYADRRYLKSGRLMPRDLPGAVITDPNVAASQAVSIATHGTVTVDFNHEINVIGDSICVHGDNPSATETIIIARNRLTAAGILIRPRQNAEKQHLRDN